MKTKIDFFKITDFIKNTTDFIKAAQIREPITINIKLDEDSFKKLDEDLFFRNGGKSEDFVPSEDKLDLKYNDITLCFSRS